MWNINYAHFSCAVVLGGDRTFCLRISTGAWWAFSFLFFRRIFPRSCSGDGRWGSSLKSLSKRKRVTRRSPNTVWKGGDGQARHQWRAADGGASTQSHGGQRGRAARPKTATASQVNKPLMTLAGWRQRAIWTWKASLYQATKKSCPVGRRGRWEAELKMKARWYCMMYLRCPDKHRIFFFFLC